MYVHSVELINYKSIGDTDATIILEPNITAIIGMNESGKSNVLEGLSQINFLKKNNRIFLQGNSNRNQFDSKIRFKIVLKPSPQDTEINETVVEISESNHSVMGGLCDYYNSNLANLFSSIIECLDAIDQNPFGLKDKERQAYNGYRSMWKSVSDPIDVPAISAGISFLEKYRGKITGDEKSRFDALLDDVKEKWQDVLNRFPVFFYRKADKQLKLTYKADEIEKELNNPASNDASLLNELVQLIGITRDEFIQAAKAGDSSVQISSREKINDLINKKINS